jgi:hypothetical protein
VTVVAEKSAPWARIFFGLRGFGAGFYAVYSVDKFRPGANSKVN